MIPRFRLITLAALTLGSVVPIAGFLPAAAEPRIVARDNGITVFEDSVPRSGGGAGTLLIARFDPERATAHIVQGNGAPPADAPWSVTINGSFFDRNGKPLHHLRESDRVLSPFRKGANAVFWCRDGGCAIQHSSDFAADRSYEIAVQAAPRLMGNGRPTKGVRGADVVDGRAGLAMTADGAVLVFATSPLAWGGLSFDSLREYLTENFPVESILMLDGGNSARLRVRIGERSFSNGSFSRDVPYSIRFIGR